MLFGYADDHQLINLYRNAEFLIYPSFYEGFGLPVVEAMACGCPVIASNASSLPEIMPDDEWLVDPYNPADMADKMQRMLALSPDRRHEIVEKNQKHARNFTWEKTASRMIEIFEGLHCPSPVDDGLLPGEYFQPAGIPVPSPHKAPEKQRPCGLPVRGRVSRAYNAGQKESAAS